MSAPAFTPGPWHADKVNAWNVWSSDCKVAKTFDVGQSAHYRDPSEDERIANARLIAAAPTAADYIRRKAEAGDEEAQQIWEMICGRR